MHSAHARFTRCAKAGGWEKVYTELIKYGWRRIAARGRRMGSRSPERPGSRRPAPPSRSEFVLPARPCLQQQGRALVLVMVVLMRAHRPLARLSIVIAPAAVAQRGDARAAEAGNMVDEGENDLFAMTL